MFTTKLENNVLSINFKSLKPYNLFEDSIFNQFLNEIDKFLNASHDGLIINIDENFFETSHLLKSFTQNNFDKISKFQKVLKELENYPKPIVSIISENIHHIGIEFIMISDKVLANTDQISFSETNNFIPFGGAIQRLIRRQDFDQATRYFFNESNLVLDTIEKIESEDIYNYVLNNILAFNKKDLEYLQKTLSIHSPKGYQFFPVICAKLFKENKQDIKSYKALLDCVFQGGQLPFEKALTIDRDEFISLLV